jgi:predicted acylesterase/phospholipase RssA
MASPTLPEFYEYEEISGHKFWDGGLLSNTPIRELIQAHKDFGSISWIQKNWRIPF